MFMSANTDTEGNDMNELVYILEAAKEHKTLADIWWKTFQETNDSSDYAMWRDEFGCAQGLLEAYKIVSGRKVFGFTIDEELAAIA